jgi:hypothetical protein
MLLGFSLCLVIALKESERSALGQREIDDDLGGNLREPVNEAKP